MKCCRPDCGVAMIVVGAGMAFGDIGRTLAGELLRSSAVWMWLAILAVVLLVSFVIVSPTSAEEPSR